MRQSALIRGLLMITARQDIFLAIMLLVAIFMMILPLPTVLVDLLIAINLAFSVILLMISIYLRDPLEFSVFPSLLLITTLYRLALTISTTRLVLLQHDAGEIVEAFGQFVVGGNLAVGLIIFTIITVVQFIVITKGSERVAEVSARFSLDGMPGKQMSIDGDMRAGVIDAAEAGRLRERVQKESRLFGAMDGAMKFVKGDAIAGIIVILVNIIGGITIGVLTMLLGLVLIAVIFFAPQPYNVEGHEFVLTRTIVAVGLFGGYVAVVAVFLAIAGFSPRRFAVHSGDVDAAAEASTDDIARAAGAASTPNPTRDNA